MTILPLVTRVGCGLELWQDAPVCKVVDKGQLADIKAKRSIKINKQIRNKTPKQNKTHSRPNQKTHLNNTNAVPVRPGSLSALALGKEIPGTGSLCLQGLLWGSCIQLCHRVLYEDQSEPVALGTPFPLSPQHPAKLHPPPARPGWQRTPG